MRNVGSQPIHPCGLSRGGGLILKKVSWHSRPLAAVLDQRPDNQSKSRSKCAIETTRSLTNPPSRLMDKSMIQEFRIRIVSLNIPFDSGQRLIDLLGTLRQVTMNFSV
jgi:hypothetical protein